MLKILIPLNTNKIIYFILIYNSFKIILLILSPQYDYWTKQLKQLSNLRFLFKGFPSGAVVKKPPANAGDKGLSPGPGRSHMPRSN